MAKIALVDDHVLLRNGLASLISSLGHTVLFEADNGREFCDKLDTTNLPDMVLLDINMPEMDGYETCRWLTKHQPGIKVIALSMYDNESAIISMLKEGAKGYLLKDSDPMQLNKAIQDVEKKGFYYSEMVSGKMMHAIHNNAQHGDATKLSLLTVRELDFLKFSCSELTYKEIADKMCVSPRTVDGYRDALFEKLEIKTRVGLAIYAIKNGIVDIAQAGN